jgi:hypothetical protein
MCLLKLEKYPVLSINFKKVLCNAPAARIFFKKMLMKPAIHLHIDTPCHENWAAMTPTDEGRFCQACTKQVVDFSTMTDQQILHFLSKASGNICGRLGNDQLSRPLIPATEQPKAKWWWTLLMPLLLVFDRAAAQKKPLFMKQGEVAMRPVDTSRACHDRVAPAIATAHYTISGTVADEKGAPVAGAFVRAEEWGRGTMTDSTGAYKLVADTYTDNVNISVSFIGYTTIKKEVKATSVSLDFVLPLAEAAVLQEVIVRSYPSIKGQIRMGGMSVVTHRKIVAVRKAVDLAPSFSVYPNPVQKGQQLTVATKELNDFTVQVISGNGVVLFSQSYYAAKGVPQQIAVPSHWAGGIYYVRLVNEKNKKQYTEKILVK